MRKALLLAALVLTVIPAWAEFTVTVDPANVDPGAGIYGTVRGAINSFCPGGGNAAETPPFIIEIVAGTYKDDFVSLDQTKGGVGNVVGDIVIKAKPGEQVILSVQPSSTRGCFEIVQDVHNVTLQDLIICPGSDAVSNYVVQSVLYVNETAANTTTNTLTVENCVITESDPDGDPLITSKTAAVTAGYPTDRGTKRSVSCRMFRKASLVGGTMDVVFTNCTLYGARGYGSEMNMNNAGESITFTNCLTAWSGLSGHRMFTGTNGRTGALTFTGTDQTAGPLNCNAILGFGVIQPVGDSFGGEGISLELATEPMNVLVEKSIIWSDYANSKAKGIQDYEGVIGSTTGFSSKALLTVRDTIIGVAGSGLVIGPDSAATIERVTLDSTLLSNPTAAGILFGSDAAGSLTVSDCIFSGIGQKIKGTLPTGGCSVDDCGFVEAGDDAITSRDEGQGVSYGSNIVTADPRYASKDAGDPFFMDVRGSEYAGAASDGSDLAGGANFIAPSTSVAGGWELYR